MIYDHKARPGPLHWDYRCMRCNGDVLNHGGWWARFLWRRAHRA